MSAERLLRTRRPDRSAASSCSFPASLALLGAMFATLVAATGVAHAQATSPYRYTVPPGWTRAIEGDIEMLAPQAEPAGNVQVMLIPPKPANGEFRVQFENERAALEQFWALRAPRAVAPQGGRATAGEYGAHFASYDSDSGARYMGFLGLGDGRQFALVVFVANSDDGFNRLARVAVEVFKGLSFSQ